MAHSCHAVLPGLAFSSAAGRVGSGEG